jgi:hypothetical protein
MTDLQFTPNGTYNGYTQWEATDGIDTYSIVWNLEGYWEMLGWSVGDLRSYSSPNITPLDGWRLYNTTTTGIFNVFEGYCIPLTPTPTPTNTVTPTVTPTSTLNICGNQDSLVDPIITENEEYIIVGNCEYLMFIYSEPSPTPTNTVTSTPTITPTQTPTITPTQTPTITPVSCTGIPYNLSTIFDIPISGDILFANLGVGEASNNPDGINEYGGVYFNVIDFNGTDQTSYFSNLIGNNFLLTLCQNNVTATYSGSSDSFQFLDTAYYCSTDTGANFIETISANTLFNFGEIVYIDYSVVAPSTPTPTPTVTETPTNTPTISVTPTITPTITETPTNTPTISVTPTITPTITCSRPEGLSSFSLVYVCNSVVITGSLIDACNSFNCAVPGSYSVEAVSLNVGEIVYLFSGVTSCETIPTGYYTYNNDTVIYIVNGVVDSYPICPSPTPTPTNTVTPTVTPSFGINCRCVEVVISQLDIDSATGNTSNPSLNGVVRFMNSVGGSNCSGGTIFDEYSTPGTYYYCMNTLVGITNLYYYENNSLRSYPSISSTYTILRDSMCIDSPTCLPATPTPTISQTPTMTPTPTTPLTCDTFTFNGINANTTINSAINTGGGGWDSSAYSTESYTTPVTLTFQTTANGNYLMGGFSYNPTSNPTTYLNTTYGLYIQPNFLEIYENGGQVTVPGSMTNLSTDVWKVIYNGTNVTYYKNDVLIYTSSNPVTQPLHIFFPLLTQNEGVTNVCVIG